MKTKKYKKMTPAIFIKRLYKLLSKFNICFVSGAFVFEDKNRQLFKLLVKDNNFSKFPGLTHDSFQKGDFKKLGMQRDRYILGENEYAKDIFKIKENKSCNGVICEELSKTKKIFCLKCDNKIKECKGIIKFYKFATEDKEQDRHVFLKLEKYRTILPSETIAHWNEKRKRSSLEKIGIEGKVGEIRREDCKDKCTRNWRFDNWDNISKQLGCCEEECENINNSIKIWNEKYRQGDEMFIPQFITNILLGLRNITPCSKGVHKSIKNNNLRSIKTTGSSRKIKRSNRKTRKTKKSRKIRRSRKNLRK